MIAFLVSGEFKKLSGKRIKTFAQRDAEDQPIQILKRQRTEQERVNCAENGGVGANAEGQRDDGNHAKGGRFRQQRRGVMRGCASDQGEGMVRKRALTASSMPWIAIRRAEPLSQRRWRFRP